MMKAITQQNVSVLLEDYVKGDKSKMDELLPYVYWELKKISSRFLAAEYRNHTFQTTELVHEAYIRMVGNNNVNIENRAHFYGIAAQLMRQILVDHARRKKAVKRGEGKEKLEIDNALGISIANEESIIELDDALKKLETLDARPSKVIELRFFSGLTIDETARYLNISRETAKRDWTFAKAWLYRELKTA
ncbi:MAG: sigma-70 family RNA polymerase sigma factor [Bacteroidales bacterium]|nr:sigma-70 family RNA polymerase sigma factor [Bacteroidales bacterium]